MQRQSQRSIFAYQQHQINKPPINKFSYCRDRACPRSSRHSKSFKATDFSTNRNPICYLLLVNHTNVHHISFARYSAVLLIAFDSGCLSLD